MNARIKLVSGKHMDVYQAMLGLEKVVHKSTIEPAILYLLKIRASQINGCGYCLDMHTKDARLAGETEQRIYLLDTWREATIYSPRERAALAWAEAVTRLDHGQVSDSVYQEARGQFSEEELVKLTLAVVAINGWNRLNISFKVEAGSYEPGSLAKMKA